jgi:arginyl-tRNA synthetase
VTDALTAFETAQDPCRFALAEAVLAVQPLPGVSVRDLARLFEKPPENAAADYALPCFRFAKAAGKSPQDFATTVAARLKSPWVESAAAQGAFLNINVPAAKLAEAVLPRIADGSLFHAFKDHPLAKATRVMIEFSQPNTHKEFHVGHARNVALGDSLCRLYRYCGYQVTAANYFGDEGTHIAECLWYIKRSGLSFPETDRGAWLGKQYAAAKRLLSEKRAEFQPEVSAVLAGIESKKGEWFELWQKTRQWSLDAFMDIYAWLDVHFDILFHESDVSEESQTIVDEYLQRGVFKVDDGAVGVDLSDAKLGFMIVRKRDGNTLYATKDLALARRKFGEYQIDKSIYVVGDEQKFHFQQVFKTLEKMGFPQAPQCYHLSYGMVVLPEGKMSSREGNSVGFVELRNAVAAELDTIMAKYADSWDQATLSETKRLLTSGTIKYGMLSTDPVKKIVFDLQSWTSFEGNSGPYLMYSYARTQSILAKANWSGPTATAAAQYSHPLEKELLRHYWDFNQCAWAAAENYRPSIIANHLFAMCKAFNRFYAEVPVLKAESPELVQARLNLVYGFAEVLKQGLLLLGITPADRM